MGTILLVLVFALVFLPFQEVLLGSLWSRWTYASPDPHVRHFRILVHMGGGLLGSTGLGILALSLIRMSPTSQPLFPEFFRRCIGHGEAVAPGGFTIAFLLAGWSFLAALIVGLFYPLPWAPRGQRDRPLERLLEGVGVSANVEILPEGEPACYSEATPYPRVTIHGGAEEKLTTEELRAVLLHEAGHLLHGDHRTQIWTRAYRRLLFFFPGADQLHRALAHEQERRADDQTLKWQESLREPLGSALLHLALQDFPGTTLPLEPETNPSPDRAEFENLDQEAWSLQQRLSRLAGGPEAPPGISPSCYWALPGALLLLLLTQGETGPCTLHCLLVALP